MNKESMLFCVSKRIGIIGWESLEVKIAEVPLGVDY
jgi:hypothetical protein